MKTDKSPEATNAPVSTNVKVAYHDGPPAIGFFGSRWEKGKAREVSAEDWAAMQARPDCAPFDFKVV